jgi:hypothetical protein
MSKPILLIGPQGSGKTFLANIMAAQFELSEVHLCDVYGARLMKNFIGAGQVQYKCIIVDTVPGETELNEINNYFKGIIAATHINPLIIYTIQSHGNKGLFNPYPNFHKIYCSYELFYYEHFKNSAH